MPLLPAEHGGTKILSSTGGCFAYLPPIRVAVPHSVLPTFLLPLQTRVRFVTKHSKYQVPTTPFSVPQRINRLGLNEIVNHLLSNGE